MGKILLFYKYIYITYPEQIRKWQERLCKQLNLKGRILIAHEGINGTLGGTLDALNDYKKEVDSHPLFGQIDFKESDGDSNYFPRLRIVVRNEVTHLGLDPAIITAKNGGIHLTPEQTHNLLKNAPQDLIIFDARNNYESRIGAFENALKPDIKNFRDLPEYIDNNLDLFKDKEVLMYCTGGIRCERGSAYLKSKNVAKKVYQIEGGIHRYAEKFPDGFFRGKNYVFDGRIAVKVNDDILGSCELCSTPHDEYTNCLNTVCNKQFIVCEPCIKKLGNTCSAQCFELVQNKKVVVRKISKKTVVSEIQNNT
jgi:predicted sulfurtransferase